MPLGGHTPFHNFTQTVNRINPTSSMIVNKTIYKSSTTMQRDHENCLVISHVGNWILKSPACCQNNLGTSSKIILQSICGSVLSLFQWVDRAGTKLRCCYEPLQQHSLRAFYYLELLSIVSCTERQAQRGLAPMNWMDHWKLASLHKHIIYQTRRWRRCETHLRSCLLCWSMLGRLIISKVCPTVHLASHQIGPLLPPKFRLMWVLKSLKVLSCWTLSTSIGRNFSGYRMWLKVSTITSCYIIYIQYCSTDIHINSPQKFVSVRPRNIVVFECDGRSSFKGGSCNQWSGSLMATHSGNVVKKFTGHWKWPKAMLSRPSKRTRIALTDAESFLVILSKKKPCFIRCQNVNLFIETITYKDWRS